MFADATTTGTPLGWFTNPAMSTSMTLALVVALAVLAWWLARGDRIFIVQEFVAGHVRRLLVRRGGGAPPTVPPPETSSPEHPAPKALTASRTSPRATIAVAAIPSVASLVWTAWSLMDMIPAPWPVGLAAGVVLDVALVSAVAIAWIAPQVARPAKVTGWLIATLAAVLVGYHAAQILPVLAGLGLIPLVAKGLWHLALNARLTRAAAEDAQAEADRVAAQENARRDAELSTDLTHEQQKEIVERKRQATYKRSLAEADRDVAAADADAEHEAELAKIARLGEQRRAMGREAAKVELERQRLMQEINASRPASFALLSGEVPSDLSSLPVPPDASVMGFGGVMGSDLGVSRGRPVGDAPVGDPRLQSLMEYIAAAGPKASVRGAATELRVAPATIRRWRGEAEERGLDVSALKRTK